MKQIKKELLVGASYSERFAKAYKISIPKEIKKSSDAKFVPLPHSSHANDKAIGRASELISKFDEIAEEIIQKYNKYSNDLKYFDLGKIINKFKEGHKSTEQLIKVYESVLSGGDINPTTYLNAKRHFIIAKIFLDKFKEIKTEDIERLKNKKLELNTEAEKENFKLGVFISLEPILVTAILSTLERDNAALSQDYGKLIDEYNHIVAIRYPNDYLKATQLDKSVFPAGAYSKLLSLIKVERHDQVLL